MLRTNVDPTKPNKFTFTDHKSGKEWDLLGPDGQIAAEKIEEVMKGLTPKQQRKLHRRFQQEQEKLAASKLATEKGIAETSSTLGLVNEMMATVDAWETSGLRLERPSGSGLHRLLSALRDGGLHALDESTKAALTTLGAIKPVSFVVEHDWSAAFANATDFADGDYKLPYDNTIFEFRASGKQVCVLSSESFGCFLFVEMKPDWLAIPWDRNADFFSKQIRAVCIALDADVAVAETVRAPERLNRARAANSKPLMQDYHVIRLSRRERPAPLPEAGGGTHRSPRMHFVRGHWRHYENHKTWIKWYLRGNPDLGFIDKHYRL